jgi:porin
MRIVRIGLIAAVLAVSVVRGQEPDRVTSLAGVPDPPTANAAEPPGGSRALLAPPTTRRDYPIWRPLSRWLARTRSARETPGVMESGDGGAPTAVSDGTELFAPPVAGESGDARTTRTGQGDPTAPPEAGAGASPGSEPISANPAAVNIIAGTGALGRLLGLGKDSGIRLGGLWIGDASGILSGGRDPGAWGLNSLTVADLNLDTEKLFGWAGGSFGIEFLQFSGQPTNKLAGAFPGFDSLEVTPPLIRQELYQLWYRQSMFDDKLIFRIGKMVPTFDFNNVVRPVPVSDAVAAIPAVTGLIYTPIFVNPTMLGVIPGYYNSACGITTTLAPTKSLYLNYGFYDGNLAKGVQTGLEGPHFNGYYFHIGEFGYSYRLGAQRKPGNFGVGAWGQTGKLSNNTGGTSKGANGVYLFGAQRLWFRRPGLDSSGVTGFFQFGANDSNALLARYYVGGGMTAFGLVPGRPDDSFGFGLNCTWLTGGSLAADVFYGQAPFSTALPPLRPSQFMLQWYYQMKLVDGWFFQTTLTDIPTPGERATIPNAIAITFRLTVLF